MNPLEWLGAQDDKYSEAIRRSFTPPSDPNIIDTARAGAHSFLGVPRELPENIREGYNNPGGKFVHTAGMASRYALPGLGVTAAGIALADLAGYFGGNPDQPEQGQLGLDNGEMSALGVIAASPLLAGGAAAGLGLFEDDEITAGNDQLEILKQAQAAADEAQVHHQAAAEANQAVAKAGRQRRGRGKLPRSNRRR